MTSFSNFKSQLVAASTSAAGIELGGGGTTAYSASTDLPTSNVDTGEMAFVSESNKLYMWNGSAWFHIAMVNQAPTGITGGSASYELASNGTPTIVTLLSTDPEGFPLTWSYTGDAGSIATVSQTDNVFTITPSTDTNNAGEFSLTFSVTDGNNTETATSAFTLRFTSPLWNETLVSVGTSSTDGLDNSTFIDRSTNAHTVTSTGSPTQTAFHPYLDNWSVEFDGSDIFTLSNASEQFVPETQDFTYETWFYTSDGTRQDIYSSYTTTSGFGVALSYSNFGDVLVYKGNTLVLLTTGGNFNLNQWHHVAISRSGTSLKVFIDGTEIGSATDSTDLSGTATLYVAAAGNHSLPFTGYLSNTRFVKGTAVYTSAFTPPTEPLTAISGTSLLTCQSNRFIDNSTNAHAITLIGDPKVSAFNPFGQESEYAPGLNKGSVYLGGSPTLHISSIDTFAGTNLQFTVECWFYATALTNVDTIFGLGYTNRGFSFRHRNGNLQALSAAVTVYEETMRLNEWYHIAVEKRATGDGSDLSYRYYINGQVVHTTADGQNALNSTENFSIGEVSGVTWNNNYPFTGYVSDVKMTSGLVYNGGFTLPTAPVDTTNASLYLPMDNAGVFDKTGNTTLSGNASTSTADAIIAPTAISFDNSPMLVKGNGLGIEYRGIVDGDFTIEFWAKCTVEGQACILFDNHATSWGGDFNMRSDYVNPPNGGMYGKFRGTSVAFAYDVNQFLNVSSHWAITCSSNTLRIYQNGVQKYTATVSGTSNISNGFYIGGSAGPSAGYSNLTGSMEGFQFLNGIAKYTTNFTPPTQEQGMTYQAES